MSEPEAKKTRLALFDICQTLVRVTTLGDFVENFFLSPERNPYFKRSVWFRHFVWRVFRGRTPFLNRFSGRNHLCRLFRGYSTEQLRELGQLYSAYLMGKLKREVVDEMHRYANKGYRIIFVTAGLDAYLHAFAESLGAELVATTLEVNSRNRYTGRILGPVCIGEGKVKKLNVHLNSLEIDWGRSVAFGDDMSDIPLLSLVGEPVAVNPAEGLRVHAEQEKWRILETV